MFDVEQQLEDWRTRFTRTEAMRGTDIEELEQHVRDSIATLMSNGLNAEEAFLIATRRVGSPAALDREFGKVNGDYVWGHRALWMIAGALTYLVCGTAIGAIASISQVMVAQAGGGGTLMGYTALAVTVVAWSLLLAALWQRRHDGSPALLPGRMSAPVIGIALLAAAGLKQAVQVAWAWITPVSEIAEALPISMWANVLSVLVLPLVLLLLMVAIQRRMREAGGLET
jgi:hypothetical protein